MNKKIRLQTLTLWDFPSQHYLREQEHAQNYKGATPSYIIWNLLQRYTRPGDVVIDPMCGAGTTLDVAKELNREALGFDLNPTRKDIKQADARKIPIEKATADFVFIDPPYSTHITYSGKEKLYWRIRGHFRGILHSIGTGNPGNTPHTQAPPLYGAFGIRFGKKRETVSSDRVQSVQHSERLFPAGGYYCRNTPQCKTSQESLAQRSS